MQNLDLNETQQKDIRTTVREYRGHLLDLREAVQRADSDLQVALIRVRWISARPTKRLNVWRRRAEN